MSLCCQHERVITRQENQSLEAGRFPKSICSCSIFRTTSILNALIASVMVMASQIVPSAGYDEDQPPSIYRNLYDEITESIPSEPLRAEYTYKFQRSDSPDDLDYFFFTVSLRNTVSTESYPPWLLASRMNV
jgi:hypothetical protein